MQIEIYHECNPSILTLQE